MKPETFFEPETDQYAPSAYAALLALGMAALIALAIYWPTVQSMVQTWSRSDTFAHGYLVLPVVVWLIWQERRALAPMHSAPTRLPLALIAGAGLVWLASRLSAVLAFEQFALIFMIQFTAVALLGWKVSRRLAIPLLFLLFAVPFGEVLLPTLIDGTADATVALLRLSGVPVFREGNHFQLPTGRWSVVEACSGLRYLIASLFGGTIYAYVRYRSAWRRLAFVAASIVVPIIANWLRAYGIVMLAHHTDNRLGVSVDHLVYGWIFFGFVMLLLFWVGSLWTEESAPAAAPGPESKRVISSRDSSAPIWRTAVFCLIALGVWPLALAALEGRDSTARVQLPPIGATAGWQASSEAPKWKPRFLGAHDELAQRFVHGEQRVDLYIAYYRDQSQGSELIGSKNQLVYAGDNAWRSIESGLTDFVWTGRSISAQHALILGDDTRLTVREIYWVDGSYTGSEYMAKALLAFARLRGRGDDSAAIVLATPQAEGAEAAKKMLERFSTDMSTPIAEMLHRTRAQR